MKHHRFCRYPNSTHSHYCYHATGHCDQCNQLKTRDHCPLVPITERVKKEFHFEDGNSSFTMTAEEILLNDTEDDEPELYEFARTAAVGEILSGANLNGLDVKRIK